MNKIILIGRLTADPELKQTASGKTVTSFNIAVDRRFSNEPKADFFPCVAWNKTAEFVCRYFGKGRKIAIEGRLETRTWQAQDGTNRYATEVIVEAVEFADSKPESNGYGAAQQTDDGFIPMGDCSEEDLPF